MEYGYKFKNILKDVPKAYIDADISKIEPQIAKQWEDIFHRIAPLRFFYLYGGTGVGKTYTAYAIKKLLSDNNHSAVVVKNTAIIKAIKNSFNFCRDDDPRFDEILDDNDFLRDISLYKGLLIIDDIGSAEKDTPAVIDRYFEIIDERSENGRPMSFTSNFSPNELVPKIGKRTVDRMMMECDPIELVGINRRLQ